MRLAQVLASLLHRTRGGRAPKHDGESWNRSRMLPYVRTSSFSNSQRSNCKVLEGCEKTAKQSRQLASCTRRLYLPKSQILQDRTISLGRALICETSSRPASARIRQKIISSDRSLGDSGNGMRGDKRTSYIQVCSFVTLTFTYKWSFQHWALKPRVLVSD